MGLCIMGHLKHDEKNRVRGKKPRKRKNNRAREKIDKTSLDFLSEAKNLQISYLYETHEVEFIMLRS